MPKTSLKQAPTLVVIGVAGLAAWPSLFPEAAPRPPEAATRPSTVNPPLPPAGKDPGPDPFRLAQVAPAKVASPAGSKPGGPATASAAKSGLPAVADDEDRVLRHLKLGGTFVDGSEQLAIIDGKVYARGESIRGADGSTLPYRVVGVSKDHAMLRRGRRDFLLGFSNAPRPASTRTAAPNLARSSASSPVEARAAAKASPPAPPRPGPSVASKATKPDAPRPASGEESADLTPTLVRLLSGLAAGGETGQGTSTAALPPGLAINPATLAAGLDALDGKTEDLIRGGGPPPASGETLP